MSREQKHVIYVLNDMKILVTGAKGFVGRNLCAQLRSLHQVYEYDIDSSFEDLDRYCKDCDFVFNLAGVNRPDDPDEFMRGNYGFASILLDTLKKHGNRCPVMLSSSVQAGLKGRFAGSEYGKSKRAGEELFLQYERATGVKILIYRFPNIFGKWCRPGYNSVVATFCHNIANDLPIRVDDPEAELELLYIDDLVDELISALSGDEHICLYDTRYCYCPATYKVRIGSLVDMIYGFADQTRPPTIPDMLGDSLIKKLYSTYVSYLPKNKVVFPLDMHMDSRGSFTELIRTEKCGQISVNISSPGVVKGQHWHNSKWELFIVVSGRGLIQQRRIDSDEVLNFEVSGDRIEAVHILPGYTHNIINLSDTEDLVTIMWANEPFNPDKLDTFYMPVE